MPRGRGSDRPLIVELVPDDEDGVGAHATPHPASSPDGTSAPKDPAADPAADAPGRGARFRAWLARQPRTRLVVAGVAALALVAGAGVAATVADQRRVERLRALPGGVVDLATPPHAAWTTTTDGAVWPVAQVGSLLVVMEQESLWVPGAAEGGSVTLRALDPATGEDRWSRDVPASTCGPGGITRSERLVCVVRTDGGWSALVLDAAGDVVAERALPGVEGPAGLTTEGEPPPAAVAMPTADGGLLRLVRLGEPPTMPELVDEGVGDWRPRSPILARDLRVTLEDAVTGQERWSTTLAAEPTVDVHSCISVILDGDVPRLDGDTKVWVDASGDVVTVEGCGVSAQLTPEGVRLGGGEPWGVRAVAVADGYAVPPAAEILEDGTQSFDATGRWSLVRRDGTAAGELPGPLIVPAVTDGTGEDLLFVREGGALVALRTDGLSPAWRTGRPDSGVLAQVDGTVLTVEEGRLVGLDAATGRSRWATDVGAADAQNLAMTAQGMGQAFTDGRRVVVLSPDWGSDGSAGKLTAYDVGTGEVVWSQPFDGDVQAWTLAVDGHLLRGGPDRIEGLG
ncbi:outer membrane protein assembly factor BamB family protein [Puerhibacterium puerhi]|uniref:outer membrane protein assembly factor BamB family protein n=1 Tax=Puerhibacterium puerhi TaxID=2692623 RepID=UPI00135B7736|nr:PQQ-binding-like beta-propeller repeat protein [Puerhibacterium puerhi]